MIERLLENWLDSASERSYQGPFLQMLLGAGYALVHNTRHTPIEFGKDIIARDPAGQIVGFQLKGNPGATMNLNALREIYPQLIELSTFAINYPGVDNIVPKPFFVLNGELGEDAQKGLGELNAGTLKANPVTVWSRGKLLDMAKSLSSALWPSEIPDVQALLKILVVDTTGPFPVKETEELCGRMLGLTKDKMDETKPEMQRRIASAGLLIGICVYRHAEKKNHWAAIQAWTMLCGLIAACVERYDLDIDGPAGATFDLSLSLVDQSLKELAEEVIERTHLAQGGISDALGYQARVNVLTGLMAAFWHRAKARGDDADVQRAVIALTKCDRPRDIWGEAAFPAELLRVWAFDHVVVSNRAERIRIDMMNWLLKRNRSDHKDPLPPPYYGFDEAMKEKFFSPANKAMGRAPYEGDKHAGACFMGLSLFEELVRQNLKQHAKAVWPELTRLVLREVQVPDAWEFPLGSADCAVNLSKTLMKAGQWDDQVNASYADDPPPMPAMLKRRPDVVGLLILLHPQRASPPVVRWLSKKLGRPWLS
ncbi:MAG: hypothetical protein HYV18_00365 [Gammaproteobacteria bacterium]|nr:hypothetical protein [Gammaproteobacteria bacterium]